MLGEHNLNVRDGSEMEFRIQTAIKHPKYNKKTVDSDIALLKWACAWIWRGIIFNWTVSYFQIAANCREISLHWFRVFAGKITAVAGGAYLVINSHANRKAICIILNFFAARLLAGASEGIRMSRERMCYMKRKFQLSQTNHARMFIMITWSPKICFARVLIVSTLALVIAVDLFYAGE